MGGFEQFIPLIIIIGFVVPAIKYGWRTSWIVAFLWFIPVVNVYVMYRVGKDVHSRIDALENELHALKQ